MENDEIQQDGAENTAEEKVEETVTAGTEAQEDTTDWKAEALKYKAILKRTAEKKEAPAKPVAPVNVDDIDSVLSLQAEGYSPAEIKSLREYGRKMGKPINEVAEDSVIKLGFEAMRQKAKTEAAIPSPSKKSTTFKGKSLTDVVLTGSPSDAQSAIEQHFASRMGRNNNNE